MFDLEYGLTLGQKSQAFTSVLKALDIPVVTKTARHRALTARMWQMIHLDQNDALVAADLAQDLANHLANEHCRVFSCTPAQIEKASGWDLVTIIHALALLGAHNGSWGWSNADAGQVVTKVEFPKDAFSE